MTDNESDAFFARIEYLEKENEWLRSINGPLDAANLDLHVQVKVLKEQLAECQKFDAWKANPYTKILEDSLAECQAKAKHWEATCHDQWENYEQQLAESQAREKVLREGLKKIAAVDPGNQFSCQSGMAKELE